MSHIEHKKEAPVSVALAILTVSDTRTLETDRGGKVLEDGLSSAGHHVVERVLSKDDAGQIRSLLDRFLSDENVQAIILTGGTGIANRDGTPEVVEALLEKKLDGFGEIFRMLSYEEVGPAAILSRAVAGIAGKTFIASIPGSSNACTLALEKLFLPELAHFVHEANK